jgi:hypothetical protein
MAGELIFSETGGYMEDEIKQERQQQKLIPGAGAAYGHGWRQMWKYFLELLLITIVSFLLSIPTLGLYEEKTERVIGDFVAIDLIFIEFQGPVAYIIFALAFLILFEWPLEYGMSYGFLRSARGESLQVKDIFHVFKNYSNAVFGNLLVAVIVGVGFMLLIIPGIVFACKLPFVSYLIVDKKMDAVTAVKTSWHMTHGHAWQVFLIGILAFFVALLGLILFGVGLILSIMWIRLAFASLYYAVSAGTEENIQSVEEF